MLGLVTSDYLYNQHPNEHEGQLTKTKSLLVSKAILSRRGLAMGLGRFVLMSHSEIESGGRQRLSIVADAFEAVIGAIYLDLGFEAAREFIQHWLLRDYREIAADKRHTNYKSHLQEYVQSTFRTHPVYRIRSEMGPDHSKQFMVEVMVGRRLLGTGRGRNKKEAEQAAARDALERVQEHPSDRVPDSPRMEEPRPSVREPRVREPRVESAPPPRPEPIPAVPAPVEGAGLTAEVDEAFEGPRRRRGRRVGRGRRGRADEARAAGPTETSIGPPAAEPAETRPATSVPPAAARPVPPPVRPEPRRPRAEPPAYVVEPRLPEVEPLPPAYEEDENEEVGRPEGPLEERHVDPYAVEEEPAGRPRSRGDMERGSGRSVEPGFMRPERAVRSEPEDEWPPGLESETDEPDAIELEVPAHEPASAGTAELEPEDEPGSEPGAEAGDDSGWTPAGEAGGASAPPRDEPRFGRRPGRSRRGR